MEWYSNLHVPVSKVKRRDSTGIVLNLHEGLPILLILNYSNW